MSKVSVLISCMYQRDTSIVQLSHVKGDAVVINQCNEKCVQHFPVEGGEVCFVSTTERGLSRSRNMAIDAARSELCIISDDDEVFVEGYSKMLIHAFEQYPNADVIIFCVDNANKIYAEKPYSVGFLKALKVASWQISFRLNSIVRAQVRFDEQMGSGTGHGSCEEIKFIFDCLRAGLRVQYVPITLARMNEGSESQWFKGFTPQYFFNRGWSLRRLMGGFWGRLYILYFAIFKYSLYKQDCSLCQALFRMMQGARYTDYPTNPPLA